MAPTKPTTKTASAVHMAREILGTPRRPVDEHHWAVEISAEVESWYATLKSKDKAAADRAFDRLAEHGDGTVRLWDVATRQQIGKPFTGFNGSVHLAFSPDGKALATGDGATVRLWDVATRQQISKPLTGSTVIIGLITAGWIAADSSGRPGTGPAGCPGRRPASAG